MPPLLLDGLCICLWSRKGPEGPRRLEGRDSHGRFLAAVGIAGGLGARRIVDFSARACNVHTTPNPSRDLRAMLSSCADFSPASGSAHRAVEPLSPILIYSCRTKRSR